MEVLLIVCFILGGIGGFFISYHVEQKVLRDKFDLGYDTAVDCMAKDGYYVDRFNKTHKGIWIEDLK